VIVNSIADVTNETENLAQLGQPRIVTFLSTPGMNTKLLSKLMRSTNFTRNESKNSAKTVKIGT